MKFKKSISGIILALLMIFNIASSTVVYADSLDYPNAISKMKLLGIFDSAKENFDTPLTKAELVKALVIVKGLDDTAAAMIGDTIFPDVDPNSELSGYINAAVDNGIFYGTEDGYFHADNGVTYAEACVYLVRLLGYSKSDLSGSYPINYVSKAIALDITNEINFKKDDIISEKNFALMMDRTLDTNVKNSSVALAYSLNFYSDYIIMDNSTTSENLTANSVLTDKGVLYAGDSAASLQVGSTYRLKIYQNNINKIYGTAKDTMSITVSSVTGSNVHYFNNGRVNTMILPSEPVYYYHGEKISYDSLSGVLKTNMTIVFNYNKTKTGFDYAVIVNPIYSKPEVASNFNPKDSKIGNINFDENTPIIKAGKEVTKSDIVDSDVVYEVTDIYGKNKSILVLDKKAEGYITTFLPNASSPTGVQIDGVGYNFSNDMDLTNIYKFKEDDLVSGLLGYDDKIVALKSITTKTGTLTEVKIIGNSKTGDNLAENQVSLDPGTGKIGTYTLLNNVANLELGAKYNLYISGDSITKVSRKVNTLEKYVVRSITGKTVTCIDDSNNVKTMVLPEASVYYYHGAQMDYNSIVTSIQPSSTIILSKNGNGSTYDYGVIADPYYGEPHLYDANNKEETVNLARENGYSYVYRNGIFFDDISSLRDGDVYYFVSDVLSKTSYMYALNDTVAGDLKKITRLNVTSIQVDGVDYQLSQYFDKNSLYDFYNNDGCFITVYLGVDGKVVFVE